MTEVRNRDLIAALDEASLSRFHLRAVLASGMGFFTDAYDLFVIGIASALITKDWNLSSGRLALLNSTMLSTCAAGCPNRRATRSRCREGPTRRRAGCRPSPAGRSTGTGTA